MKSMTLPALWLAAASLVGTSAEIYAQSYPARPVRLIVPFSPGGAADVPGRILADRLTASLAQQVVIENRPGAGSTIGAEAAAKAPPDGYTLFMISNTHFVSAALYKKLSYDSLNDYTPITQITSAQPLKNSSVNQSISAETLRSKVGRAKNCATICAFATSSGERSANASLWSALTRTADRPDARSSLIPRRD